MSAEVLIEKYGKPIFIERKEAGSYVDGLWVDGATSLLPFVASCQPLNGKELQAMPEGERVEKTRKFYIKNEVAIILGRYPQKDDVIIEGTEKYKITSTITHELLLPHTKCIAIKCGEVTP